MSPSSILSFIQHPTLVSSAGVPQLSFYIESPRAVRISLVAMAIVDVRNVLFVCLLFLDRFDWMIDGPCEA